MSELTTRDYKGAGGRRGDPSGGLKEFLWGALAGALLAGLGTGLIMHHLDKSTAVACSAQRAPTRRPAAKSVSAVANGATTAAHPTSHDSPKATSAGAAAAQPHYDFYKMLPNLKVIVPPPTAPGTRSVGTHGRTVFSGYVVQVGSYTDAAQARHIIAELDSLGIIAHIDTARSHGTTLHRVRIGPITEEAELRRIRRVLKAVHLPAIVIPGATH